MGRPNKYGSSVRELAEDADMTPADIAAKLGCSLQTVYSNWPNSTLTPSERRKQYDRALFTKTVMEMHANGNSRRRIAEVLGVSYASVQRCLSRNKQ